MTKENNQNLRNQTLPIIAPNEEKSNKEENKSRRNWWIEILSIIAGVYLIVSLISPMFLRPGQQPIRKIETPDILLIALLFLFNSGLMNRLEDFGVSKEGGITAKFRKLDEKVNQQEKEISKLQVQQLEQLGKQQEKLEEMQAFMFNFLIGEKDYEKIDQLNKHSEAKTSYEFYVSNSVGDELRSLRDWKLIALKPDCSFISDIVKASNYGHQSLDLTKYMYVTALGKRFLDIRKATQSRSQQQTTTLQEISKVD